jgi:hypothetical protein
LLMQLTAFIKYVVYEFNKRKKLTLALCGHKADTRLGWHEEQKPECKTPKV